MITKEDDNSGRIYQITRQLMGNFTVEWLSWKKLINEKFIPLIENKDRFLILYGGRGSSKSDAISKKLIYRCLTEKYFKCVLIRNTYSSIKETSYETLKENIFDLGLQDLFQFKLQPLEIICKNGNKFIARGCDDTNKLKSLKDPTCAWYEEDIPSEQDFVVISSSIRTKKADYLQEIFTINTDFEGDYRQHWFYKRFFEKHFEESSEKTFRRGFSFDESEPNKKTIYYTCHHSTYKDNKWVPESFIDFLENYIKNTSSYYYSVFTLGEFGARLTNGLFYKLFDRAKHTSINISYNPDIPLHISYDFNVNPYIPCLIFQIEGKKIRVVDEIALTNPNNTTASLCREIKRRYQSHASGMFIYGDASGKHQDTRSETGSNDFKIIMNELEQFIPTLRVPAKNPPVKMRGDFINTIFDKKFNGIEILINPDKCPKLIQDFLFLREAPDGTKLKDRASKDGVTYQKWGHFADAFDYCIIEAFNDDFLLYQNGNRQPQRILGEHLFNTKHKY